MHFPASGAGILTNFDNLITFLRLPKPNKQLLLDIVKFADIDIQDIDFMKVAKTNKKLKNTTIYPYTNPKDGKDIEVEASKEHVWKLLGQLVPRDVPKSVCNLGVGPSDRSRVRALQRPLGVRRDQ